MGLLQGKLKLVGLPEDAEIVGFFHDWARDSLGIFIWSETFPVVERGQVLEVIDLLWTTTA